ncbi:MAG: ABC transporter permease [Bacteroidales bacterium]|nr:ABC transporter permease [Bacteroidales bacterium]
MISIEVKKIRRSPVIWISILMPLILAAIIFLIFMLQGDRLIKPDMNPYERFISMGVNSTVIVLFPLFVVILNSLIISIEHDSGGWKSLLTAPVPRLKIYLSKWSIVNIVNFLTLVLFLIFLILFTGLLAIIKPDLGFAGHKLDLGYYAWWFLKIFIATLALSTLQYQFSLWMKNTFYSIGIGLLAVIAGLILMNLDFIDYYPYAYPVLSYKMFLENALNSNSIDQALFLHEYLSLAYTAVILSAGWFFWRKKQFK